MHKTRSINTRIDVSGDGSGMTAVLFRRYLAKKRKTRADFHVLPYKETFAKYPQLQHWLNVSVCKKEKVRAFVTKTRQSAGFHLAKLGHETDAESVGNIIAEMLKERDIGWLCFRCLKVEPERTRSIYAPAVHDFMLGLTSKGIQIVVDLDAYCQTNLVGNVSRERVERTIFIPMLKLGGVTLLNLKYPVPTDDATEPSVDSSLSAEGDKNESRDRIDGR